MSGRQGQVGRTGRLWEEERQGDKGRGRRRSTLRGMKECARSSSKLGVG